MRPLLAFILLMTLFVATAADYEYFLVDDNGYYEIVTEMDEIHIVDKNELLDVFGKEVCSSLEMMVLLDERVKGTRYTFISPNERVSYTFKVEDDCEHYVGT